MIRLAPMSNDEYPAYAANCMALYAEELSRANGITVEAATAQAEATFRRLLPDGRPDAPDQYLFTVLDEEGRRAGAVWFGIRRDRKRPFAYIWDLYLEPGARGKGYGEQVMREVEQRARELGQDHIELNVFGHNLPARKLYERLGYQTLSVSMGKDL